MAFNILIVDDSPAMRAFIRRVLDMSGLEIGNCIQANNGEEALAALGNQWVDVILTDINMPVMDGEEFVRRLGGDPVLRAVPVIVVSTDQTEHRVKQMMDLGAKGYVKKPFQPETLREEMEKVLGVTNAVE
jgi:two-component system, chemotaxis family, chemotaxis protein CheY